MTRVTVTDRFDHPIEQVWPLVSDFGGIGKYLPGTECTCEGEGIGADRSLPMGGSVVVERLTWLDHEQHDLSYTILSPGPLPFARYVATIRLEADGDGTLATWEGTFEPAGAPEEKAANLARKIYTGGFKGYKAALDG